ncbi:MAG: metallophosphoesterase family protein [Sphingomonas sp.]|jgi:serine/threonine protein phosphatase 1|uniref:metallophosphoesterase family protein n=1 Tax=Sphingomonas sp. TaxID=28214 RepID=UPI0035691B6D
MFRKRTPAKKRAFLAPEGTRLYAIGDVHGRADLLEDLLEVIVRDDAARETRDSTIIFLGDLVDRGPDSAAVVARVRALCAEAGVARLVKGNHDHVLIKAARGDAQAAKVLLGIGGLPTLLSYGITEEEAGRGTHQDLADLIEQRLPRDDVAFLERGEDMILLGDYLFVHAGIRPGVALADQKISDLYWIREPFLSSEIDHGVLVIHGHSVTQSIEEQPNRIGIDTGAYSSGTLSAIGIEGDRRWFLDASRQADSTDAAPQQ